MSFNLNLFFVLSAPAGYGHELTADNRLDRILEVGELLPRILSSGRAFMAKYFPGNSEPLADLASLPGDLDEATATIDKRL